MAKKTYNVLTAIDHDNERFELGSTIDLEDKQAQPLLDLKAISGPIGDAADTEPTDPAERLAAISGAIGELDPNDKDLWLQDGKPDVAAIMAVLGWKVSAAERNAAWSAMTPA